MPVCSYITPDNQDCQRDSVTGGNEKAYCEFHLNNEHPNKPSPKEFSKSIECLIKNKGGNLKGFVFPKGFNLKGSKGNNLIFENPVDLSYSVFYGAEFKHIKFDSKVVCREVEYRTYFDLLDCIFDDGVDFTKSSFEEFFCNSTYESTCNFNLCSFRGRTTYNGKYNQKVIFNDSIFF